MKKLLKPLFTALFAGMVCTGAKAAEPQVINIRTNDLSMVMSVAPNGEVLFHHFGGRIDDASPAAGIKSYRRTDHGTDNLAYSTMGGRNFREPALRVTHADGDMNTELRYVSHATRTLADKNVSETVVKLTDTDQALDVELVYTAYAKENVITTHTVIRNREKGDAVLHAFYSSSLPVKARSYLLTHLYGSWARESQTDHTLLTHGSKSIESRKLVRTTHTENPTFMITLDSEAFDENYGEVIAGALAWSGNFRLNFEVDEFNVLNILAGVNPYASDYTLAKGESFTTPEMVYTYSFEGAGGASRNLHDWARNYGVWHGHTYAPTLLNSWEGAYFTFDAKTLTDMIDDAADMGLEMFVLDDGWFGNKYPRNDANAGLGDWQVNVRKLPEGIDYIASHAHRKGLKFGIWIEPEMVNPKSELAEKHPDWIVRSGDREMPRMRNQWPDQPQGAGLRILGIRQHDEALAQHRLHQMGRQPPCGERRIGIPAQRQAVALLDRLCAGILQGHGAHPRQISRRADPSLRFGRRPRGVRRHEVFQRGVDQRQHRSAFARPHPVRPACSIRRRSWVRTSRPRPTTRPATSRRSNSASTWPVRAVWAWSCSPSR